MSQTLAFSSNQGVYFAGQVESHRPVLAPLDHIFHPLEHVMIYPVLNQALRDQVCQFPENHPADSSYVDKDLALPLNKTNDKKIPDSRHFFNHFLSSYLRTAWKSVQKYGVFPGPYFPEFGLNTEIYSVNLLFSPNTVKYGAEKTPYLVTFHAVKISCIIKKKPKFWF